MTFFFQSLHSTFQFNTMKRLRALSIALISLLVVVISCHPAFPTFRISIHDIVIVLWGEIESATKILHFCPWPHLISIHGTIQLDPFPFWRTFSYWGYIMLDLTNLYDALGIRGDIKIPFL